MKKWLKLTARKTVLILLGVLVAISPSFQAWPVEATQNSTWINEGELQLHLEGDAIPEHLYNHGTPCNMRHFTINHRGDDITRDECVVDTEFGTLRSAAWSYFKPYHASKLGYLYLGTGSVILPVPNQEKVLFMTRSGAPSGRVVIRVYDTHKGLIEKSPTGINGYSDAYRLSRSYDTILSETDGSPIPFYSSQVGFSQNGKWMIARASASIVRVNLETLEVIAGAHAGSSGSLDLAISNDGRYGAFGGVLSKIIDFSTCGQPNSNDILEVVDGCGERDLGVELVNLGADTKGAQKLEFNSDGTVLSMNALINGEGKRIAVTAPGYEYSGLDYLALGDSFISGEGDLNGDRHYVPGTNVSPTEQLPRGERCHVSDRSYPYILARQMSLSQDRFKSVTCSGATTEDITSTSESYKGQDGRLSEVTNIEVSQDNALEKFIPGRIPQWKFVEKYKPKVVTISIGGNDVKFADILAACTVPVGTCLDASDENKRNAKAREIIELTNKLKTTYEKIHQVSKNTKIYVVGYPQIIKKDGSCSFVNNSLINSDEREFMDEGFKLINDVIEVAAGRAGVKYLDVEGALGEGRLCGNDEPKAANGLQLGDGIEHFAGQYLSGFAFEGFASESYHPNNYGHARLANAISTLLGSDTLLSHDYCQNPAQTTCPQQVASVELPQYFQAASPWTHRQNSMRLTDKDIYLLGDDAYIESGHVFMPGSNVVMELHSEPIELGQFTASQDGTLSETVTLPNAQQIEPGLHTIHTYGTLLSGEEIDFYQTIFIAGPEGDRDGNGVQDEQQACLFVAAVNTDSDFDGVDDGCDGHISDPELYRVRNGDTDKNENEEWLYVERNTRASTITGVSDDFDSDSDGWAVVGQSADSTDSGEPAHFWVDEQDIPHVSIRHPEKGCVQLTPASLAKVEDGQTRGLQQEAENTNTCRAEEPNYDADWDGVADNAQGLYRARNGNAEDGENVEDVYIERNLFAAEAQLGISDFVDNGNWAIVGVANDPSLQGNIAGEIFMESGAPYVCVDHAIDGNIVLTPESLNVVKQSATRLLIKDNTTTVSCD